MVLALGGLAPLVNAVQSHPVGTLCIRRILTILAHAYCRLLLHPHWPLRPFHIKSCLFSLVCCVVMQHRWLSESDLDEIMGLYDTSSRCGCPASAAVLQSPSYN
jgi:hypothetical protein